MTKLSFNIIEEPPKSFDCNNSSINLQIRNESFETPLRIHYTYEILIDEKLLGYYCIQFRPIEKELLPEEKGEIDLGEAFCFCAVEIKYLAIDKRYQGKSYGTVVLRSIIYDLEQKALDLPYRFIYIDALQELKDWYNREGFFELEEVEDSSPTVPMLLDLLSDDEIDSICDEYS